MKQTAVGWLAEYIKGISSLNHNEIIKQAKQIEKQQIIDAWEQGTNDGYWDAEYGYDNRKYEKGEQYYDNTFKQNN